MIFVLFEGLTLSHMLCVFFSDFCLLCVPIGFVSLQIFSFRIIFALRLVHFRILRPLTLLAKFFLCVFEGRSASFEWI